MNRPIVAGVDGLEPSRTAFAAAIAIARRRDVEVVMVHASELPESSEAFEWSSRPLVQRYRDMLEKNLELARVEIAELRERYHGNGVDVSQSFVTGPAHEAIVAAAEKHNAGLIIVGSHSRRGIDRILLGSVAERVVRSAACDTLVVRGAARFDKPMGVLVPTDFSASSQRALSLAAELANGSSITLLHCFNAPADFFASETLAQIDAELNDKLHELARPLLEAGHEVNIRTAAGYAPHLIVEFAGEHELIVMGSHGRKGVRRWLLGSVAEKTIRRAPCSVYIARASDSEDKQSAED